MMSMAWMAKTPIISITYTYLETMEQKPSLVSSASRGIQQITSEKINLTIQAIIQQKIPANYTKIAMQIIFKLKLIIFIFFVFRYCFTAYPSNTKAMAKLKKLMIAVGLILMYRQQKQVFSTGYWVTYQNKLPQDIYIKQFIYNQHQINIKLISIFMLQCNLRYQFNPFFQFHIMQVEPIIPPKSPNDNRTYQAIILPNKLKLLLIHDNQIAKGACAISVGVGSSLDKDRSLGLAHFLQHMLFMGSNKFPSHNEYSSFMNNNSGHDNAHTSDKQTTYYFEIKNSALNQGVERLTNFFTGALLASDCIEKQSQAVHEEYVLWTNDDNCRKWQILKKLASPPYSRFTIGNTDTLRHEHIRQDLVEFYNQYYSANIINAVVCSNASIKEMKDNLLQFFEAIPNKDVKLPSANLHFTKEQTGKFVHMQSIKDQVLMEFFWVVEYMQPFYKKHASNYITHVIGHEGQNSLLSILKLKNYASQLSSYDSDLIAQTIIGLEIKLTEQGQQNYEQVYNIVMDFMSTLRSQKYIYEEIKQKKLIQFQYKQKSELTNYVSHLSQKMHHIPLQEILNSSVLFDQYDADTINRFLGQLNPFNVIIVYSSNQQLEDAITEKYLGAKYKVTDLPTRDKSKVVFGPFPKNPFIPIDTKLHESNQKSVVPKKILDNAYFLENSSFRVCKGGIYLRVFSEQSFQFLQFYSSYLQTLLKQVLYPAQTLSCRIQFDYDDALTINIFGFSDTVKKVIEIIAESIHKIHNSAKSQILFNVCLNHHIESYQNFYTQDTDDIAISTLDIMLQKRQDTIQNTLKNLQKYEYKVITERIMNFWSKNKLNWIVVGNFDQNQIKSLITNVEAKLHSAKQAKIPQSNCLKLSQSILHEVRLQSQQLSSSCTMIYYQAGLYSQELRYKLQLIKNHISEPFFNELRTLKQMAYSLGVVIDNTRGVLGLKFYLISSTRDPQNISNEIKTYVNGFLAKMKQDLCGQDEKLLKQIKQSVFTKIQAPHNNLKELFQFIKREVSKKTFYYSRKEQQQVRKYLNKITASDLQQTWQQMKTRTIDLYIVSKAHEEEYNKYEIQSADIIKVKNGFSYWDDLFYCN